MLKLKEHLANTGMRQVVLARMIGISQGHMSDILAGRRTPGLALAGRIAAATGGKVPVSSWLDADHSPKTPEAAR